MLILIIIVLAVLLIVALVWGKLNALERDDYMAANVRMDECIENLRKLLMDEQDKSETLHRHINNMAAEANKQTLAQRMNEYHDAEDTQ